MISDERILVNKLWDISKKINLKSHNKKVNFEKYWKSEAIELIEEWRQYWEIMVRDKR